MTKADKLKEQALLLRTEGKSIEEIAESTGLDPQEVVDAIAEAGDIVTTLKGIKEEAALLTFGVTRKERLKRMVALRNKIEAELDSRDLSEIPTEKLPAMLLKINDAIREEVTPPQIVSTLRQGSVSSWNEKKEIANI